MAEFDIVTPSEGLDRIWAEARSLGKIKVDMDWKGNEYTVDIQFRRESGSLIWAKGEDTDICVALKKAIQEARRLTRS